MQKQNYSIYSAGKFITTNHVLEIHNPFNQSLVATTYLADKFVLEEAIIKALSVKAELQNLSSQKKYNILKTVWQILQLVYFYQCGGGPGIQPNSRMFFAATASMRSNPMPES